ncbi:RNA polymerase sigma-70 factor (sigma-E family) [Stackebrandtia endophytica]|uniref:RNA polymerase sigma-70 factor (Sigma-E family) n=1 Tax=Stackebrandtia endophytica TaxID=1496996 RepID=A0A543AT07_9ACTN|nr:SigE family RNA polymerase sigma factor [Stackebrandtia endophytica]TQL75714.1 RNA polymerase sigma-70 factor (sigma-E family) [Stackebrandtia endophytica]
MSKAQESIEIQFREFVAARSGALLRAAYLLTGNWATAEDLVQSALTKTYLAWRRIGAIDSVEAYARRVLYNTNASWWRRRSSSERPTDIIPEPRAAPDHTEQTLQRDLMWRYILGLPKRQRAVLVLRFYEDLSEADSANILGVSPGTIKSQTSRALGNLRAKMAADGLVSKTDIISPVDGPAK